jgi:hypothetical protein
MFKAALSEPDMDLRLRAFACVWSAGLALVWAFWLVSAGLKNVRRKLAIAGQYGRWGNCSARFVRGSQHVERE